MKTPLKYLIAFISLILFLILLAWLFLNYIQPATPVDQLPGKLPSLLKKLAPKLEPANENQTPFGSALDIPELVIDDPELKTGQAKLAEIGQTVTQLQTKVDSQKKVLAGYISYGESMRAKGYTKFETKIPNTLSNSAVGSADSTTPVYTGTNNPNTNTDYNQNTNSYTDPVAYNTSTSSFTNPVEYNRVVTELRNQISYYERIIYTYTTMIERFSGAIAYTYCNGYTVPKPGDVVDVTQLQYGLLLIHRSDGTTTNVPCAWKGVTTFIPIDSPFHPRNLFRNLPKWLEQYQNINLGYTDRNSWSNFDSQIRWQGNPPSVWYYYLNVFFSIYATFTVDIITDLSRLWTQFETVYPLTDWQRYQNVNVWLSSYESYFNNGHLHLEGIMQTNDAMSSICMNIRLGTRGFTRAQLDPNRIAYLFDGFDPTSISLQPLLIDEHDINGQNRQQVECTSTTAGQWKSFSYDRTDLNPNQVYLFDIIDRDFKWYDINQNTNTIELRSFRYYGPRTTDSLDTHNPVVSLIQRMDITQDQVVATGLPPGLYSSLYTQKTPRTTTSRERGSASIALLIDSQNDARALRSYRVPLTLSYTQTDRSGQITTKTANSPTNYSGYPSLPLITGANYFEVPIGTGTNYFRPFIVYFDASNFYPIDPEDTFTVENAVTGDILLPPTKFSSLNAFVNANLICGVGDGVDGGCFKQGETNYASTYTYTETKNVWFAHNRWGQWWGYIYTNPQGQKVESYNFPSKTVCEFDAKKIFPYNTPVCTERINYQFASFLDSAASKLTETSGELVLYIMGPENVTIQPVLYLGRDKQSFVAKPATLIVSDSKKQTIRFPFTINQSGNTDYSIVDSKSNTVLASGVLNPDNKTLASQFSSYSEIYTAHNNINTNPLPAGYGVFEPTVTNQTPKVLDKFSNPLNADIKDLPTLISRFARIVPYALSVFVFGGLVVTAFRMMTLGGEKSKSDEFKKSIKFVLIGSLVFIVCWLLLLALSAALQCINTGVCR